MANESAQQSSRSRGEAARAREEARQAASLMRRVMGAEEEQDRLILRPSPAVADQLERLADRAGKTREEVVVQALYLYDMFLQTVDAGGKVTFSGPDKPEDIEINRP